MDRGKKGTNNKGGVTVPVLLNWSHGGSKVVLAGSFNGWKLNCEMDWNEEEGIWSKVVDLAPGTHFYKFVVDGVWTYDSYLDHQDDGHGNINNYILVSQPSQSVHTKEKEQKDIKAEDSGKRKEVAKGSTATATATATSTATATATAAIHLEQEKKNRSDVVHPKTASTSVAAQDKKDSNNIQKEKETPVNVPQQEKKQEKNPIEVAQQKGTAQQEKKSVHIDQQETSVPTTTDSDPLKENVPSESPNAALSSPQTANTHPFFCYLCQTQKTRKDYTIKEIRKPGKRRCRMCVMRAHTETKQKDYLKQRGIDNPEEKVKCNVCLLEKPKFAFSLSRLRKGEPTCMQCRSGNIPDNVVIKRPNLVLAPEPEPVIEIEGEEKIKELEDELARVTKEIDEIKQSLETECVGHQHRAKRKTARDNLTKLQSRKENLESEITSEEAYVHLNDNLANHQSLVEQIKEEIAECSVPHNLLGKYAHVEAEDGNLVKNYFSLQSGKTFDLDVSLNDSKNFNQKSGYSFQFHGKWCIYQKPSSDYYYIKGIFDYPDIRKVHNVKDTKPPKYRAAFFDEFVKNTVGLIEGKFSREGKQVRLKVHYGDLCDPDNWILQHFFESQKFVLKKQKNLKQKKQERKEKEAVLEEEQNSQ
eukprot:TRINITY_DN2268_c0_g3_i1.p1 TRINITY_DN2268_c0_g3~~TRINITY_DN2268_c0_g3_i1.p1  ORF type:complete len:643 (+),score=176.89 TRINITY_DN2268_c0_g3_i1:71-1999(+)